jgi:hypothetical protein
MKEAHCRRPIDWFIVGLEPLLWPDLEMVDAGGIRECLGHPK